MNDQCTVLFTVHNQKLVASVSVIECVRYDTIGTCQCSFFQNTLNVRYFSWAFRYLLYIVLCTGHSRWLCDGDDCSDIELSKDSDEEYLASEQPTPDPEEKSSDDEDEESMSGGTCAASTVDCGQ